MSWLTAIPIFGAVAKKIIEFVTKRWGFNKTQQEIEAMVQEVMAEANILEVVKKLYESIVAYEGKASELGQFGWAGKIVLLARCTWRPALQWGMTVKIMQGLFVDGKSLKEMSWAIGFAAGLAVLREVGKRKNGGPST